MGKTMSLVAAAVFAAGAAHATTVTSNTLDGICNAQVVLYGSPADGGKVVLYQGALARGGIAIELYPNQGTRVCYTRSADPAHCDGQMTAPVCAPVTGNAGDVLDIH